MREFWLRNSIIVFIFLCGYNLSFGQDIGYRQAMQYRKQALQAAEDGKFRDAVQFINQCSEAAAESDNPETEALCKLAAADIYLMRNDQSSALIYRLQAAEIYKSTGNTNMLYAIYTDLAETYFAASAYQKAKEYYQRAFENAEPNQAQLFDYHFRTGNCLFEEKNFEGAALKYDFAYPQALSAKDTARMYQCLIKQINTYKALNQYDSVIVKQKMLLNIYQHRKDKLNESSVLNNMAYAYVFLDDYENALDYFKKSVETAGNLNLPDSFFISSYLNIGICYQNTNEIENSLDQLNLALKTAQKANHPEYASQAARIIALTYFEDGDIYNALTFGEMAVNETEKTDNQTLKRDIYRDYSKILQEANDYENALNYYKKHLSIRDSLLLKDMVREKDLENLIAELERAEQNLQLQLADQKVKDLAMQQMKLEAEKREQRLQLLEKENELDRAERRRIAAALELARQQKEALKKENEIKELQQLKKIQELELERKAVEEKKKEQELKLLEAEQEKQAERQSRMQWMMALGTLILLIIIAFLINSRRKNKKLAYQKRQIEEANDELNQQKEEIKSQNEYLAKANVQITEQKEEIQIINTEMTDSIIYAQRIQQAVMPSAALLGGYSADHFIFYKPRDIVSGDFYWFKEIDNKLIFTAADCTGVSLRRSAYCKFS